MACIQNKDEQEEEKALKAVSYEEEPKELGRIFFKKIVREI